MSDALIIIIAVVPSLIVAVVAYFIVRYFVENAYVQPIGKI